MSRRRRESADAAEHAGAEPASRLRGIGEVATELDLDPHVLRFWETRFSEIMPVRAAGRHRLYSPDQVALLRGIKALIHEDGMRIKGVQKTLEQKGAAFVAARGALKAELTLVHTRPGARPTEADAQRGHARAPETRAAPEGASGTRESRTGAPAAAIRTGISRLEQALARLRQR